jgi:dTDP-glucose 4,6-dehydratase
MEMNSQSGKCYLVTGAAGFIGSNFVELMVKRGHSIIILDALTYAGHVENLENIQGPGRFQLVQGNICDAQLVSRLLKEHSVDGLLNFAAESHVDRSISGPSAFIETNILGTFNLLSCSLEYWKNLTGAKRESFRYLQVSTDEVYGSLGETGKFSETTAYAPNSPYSASKAAADHLVRAWHHTYGLPTLTTNCSNNYGPKQFPEKLIPTMITNALRGLPLPVYGDGGNIRDWIHVMDHSRGILLALEKGKPGSTYCFGGNAERNNLDVVRSICRHLDKLSPRKDGKPHEVGIQFVTDRLGHDRRYAIDDTLAEKELGFVREFNFEQGLEDTLRWYLTHQSWSEAVLRKAK